jgi:type III secretory pathway component EscV
MSSLAKVNSVLEKFWWAMTAVTLILVIVLCFMDGFDMWKYYFLIPVLTTIMALMRRFMKNRLQKSEAERDSREDGKKG